MAKRESSQAPPVTANSAEWFPALREMLNDLGRTSVEFPNLFPGGITKIELELQVAGGGTLKFLVEGPPKSAGKESFLPQFSAISETAFEFTRPPEWLISASSPTEGTPADQKKLTAGVTLEGAAKLFDRNCLGKESTYDNNCAHYLTDAFIQAGFDELTKQKDCVTARCASPNCTSGGKRPIRAKDVRCWFATKDSTPVGSVQPNTGLYAVYQERQSDGQGHVVILDSGTWKWWGTGWFDAGKPAPNNWKHEYYQW